MTSCNTPTLGLLYSCQHYIFYLFLYTSILLEVINKLVLLIYYSRGVHTLARCVLKDHSHIFWTLVNLIYVHDMFLTCVSFRESRVSLWLTITPRRLYCRIQSLIYIVTQLILYFIHSIKLYFINYSNTKDSIIYVKTYTLVWHKGWTTVSPPPLMDHEEVPYVLIPFCVIYYIYFVIIYLHYYLLFKGYYSWWDVTMHDGLQNRPRASVRQCG